MTWSELFLRKDKEIGRGTLMGRRESRDNTGYPFFYFIQVDLWLKNKKFDMFRIRYVFFLGVSTAAIKNKSPIFVYFNKCLPNLGQIYLCLFNFSFLSINRTEVFMREHTETLISNLQPFLET